MREILKNKNQPKFLVSQYFWTSVPVCKHRQFCSRLKNENQIPRLDLKPYVVWRHVKKIEFWGCIIGGYRIENGESAESWLFSWIIPKDGFICFVSSLMKQKPLLPVYVYVQKIFVCMTFHESTFLYNPYMCTFEGVQWTKMTL